MYRLGILMHRHFRLRFFHLIDIFIKKSGDGVAHVLSQNIVITIL